MTATMSPDPCGGRFEAGPLKVPHSGSDAPILSSGLARLTACYKAGRRVCLPLALVSVSAIAGAQRIPSGDRPVDIGVLATVGGMHTELPHYNDNALGASVGLYLQPFSFFGAEARASAYPYSARFKQAPFTAGIRLARREPYFRVLQPFGYFGGGYSKAQDSSTTFQPLAAIWSPCWQISQGLDLSLGPIKWRMYEAALTETYTNRRDVPRRELRSLSLSTGFVYQLKF